MHGNLLHLMRDVEQRQLCDVARRLEAKAQPPTHALAAGIHLEVFGWYQIRGTPEPKI